MPEGKSAWYNSLGNEGVCLNVFIDSSLGELLPLHDIMEELTWKEGNTNCNQKVTERKDVRFLVISAILPMISPL